MNYRRLFIRFSKFLRRIRSFPLFICVFLLTLILKINYQNANHKIDEVAATTSSYGVGKHSNILWTTFEIDKGNLNYLSKEIPNDRFNFSKFSARDPNKYIKAPLIGLGDYVRTIKDANGFCRKLYRTKGDIFCGKYVKRFIEGEKVICLDPEFQIGTRKSQPNDCLVLSFGVSSDVKFDKAIRQANCEVFMFDIYQHMNLVKVIDDDPYLHFIKMGLSDGNKLLYPVNLGNKSYDVRTLSFFISDLELEGRLINILKIDIEGAEWEALQDILKQPILDIVGQIVLEVHVHAESVFSDLKNIVDRLEDRGFRRVNYEDNPLSWIATDENGKQEFYTAGELLLINSNWYNETFREMYRHQGYDFAPL